MNGLSQTLQIWGLPRNPQWEQAGMVKLTKIESKMAAGPILNSSSGPDLTWDHSRGRTLKNSPQNDYIRTLNRKRTLENPNMTSDLLPEVENDDILVLNPHPMQNAQILT